MRQIFNENPLNTEGQRTEQWFKRPCSLELWMTSLGEPVITDDPHNSMGEYCQHLYLDARLSFIIFPQGGSRHKEMTLDNN